VVRSLCSSSGSVPPLSFFNSMLDSNNEVLRRVLRADLRLASFDSSCWSAEVSNAFGGMQNGDSFKQKMLRAEKIPMQEFIGDLRYRQQKVWRGADVVFCPRAANKKAVTYHKWCGTSEVGPRGAPFCIPSYLFKDLDKHVLRNISRFRLRAHHLRVESCKWLGGSSICDKCECGEVQDEKHILLFASVLRCKSCTRDTKTFLRRCSRLFMCLLHLQMLTLFLSWLAITLSLILRLVHS